MRGGAIWDDGDWDPDGWEEDDFGPAARRRRRAAVSLTPLVDVVFILLVFFMLATSFVDWRLIDMQSRGPGRGAGEGEAVTLDVAPQALLLGGAAVSLAGLGDRLKPRLEAAPALQIVIRPQDGADMQRLVDVLDALHGAGARKVSLQAPR